MHKKPENSLPGLCPQGSDWGRGLLFLFLSPGYVPAILLLLSAYPHIITSKVTKLNYCIFSSPGLNVGPPECYFVSTNRK